MTIHYLTDRTTKCGMEMLPDGDSYTTEIEECDCRICNTLILRDIAKKLDVVYKPAELVSMRG